MWPSTVSGAGRDQEWFRIPSRVSAQIQTMQHDVGTPGPVIISLRNEDVEGILARVSARAMTAVVPEGDRVGQVTLTPTPRAIEVATCATSRACVNRVRWWSVG